MHNEKSGPKLEIIKYKRFGHTARPNGKPIKCKWCDKEQRHLRCVEEVESKNQHDICDTCFDMLERMELMEVSG